MAFIKCELKSDILCTNVVIDLYFPTDLPGALGGEAKGVITLLHGHTNTSSEWMLYSSAARYAADNGLIIIAPSLGNSFYTDLAYGGDYFNFLQNEMYDKLSKIFVFPQKREQNFIAGLSMGGYVALLQAMRSPNKWAAVASFSGCTDLKYMLEMDIYGVIKTTLKPIFDEDLDIPNDRDLLFLANNLATRSPDEIPRIFCTCGKQDDEPLMAREQNHRFVKCAREAGLAVKYTEWDGTHEWYVWDRALTMAIDFFLSNDYTKAKSLNWTCKTEEL